MEFARGLAGLRDEGIECVVAEVSSHALAQGRVDGATFDVAVFTNLSRDHLDYHPSLEDYRAAKLRLAGLTAADGGLVVNADDPAWSALRSERVIRFGIEADADYTARNIRTTRSGSRWSLVTPDATVEVELPLPGDFNVSNGLAAAAVAGAFAFSAAEIAEGLAAVAPVPGRLELLCQAPMVLRDYAHTPDALRRALAALRPLAAGRLIVVFGCGGDRDPGKRPQMGAAAAELADYSIVTSDNPRTEDPQAIIDDILPGVGAAPHEAVADRREAIARALALAKPDDAVLLAGKGHEEYQIVGHERRPFDEARLVAEIMDRGSGAA